MQFGYVCGNRKNSMFPFEIYSPVDTLEMPIFRQKRLRVHMKRDDMIHPFISGNKWRKLKYILQSAHDQGKTHLVTFGGAWSNHLLATACAAARFGFSSTAFVRGEAVSNPNLSLCQLFGMELRFVDRTAYRDKATLFAHHYGESPTSYFVDEGGYSVDGAHGCGELLDELPEQYDHIFCACGTGTTLAGLYRRKTEMRLRTRLHGVPVLKGGTFIREAVHRLVPDLGPADITLHTDYHFGGYAKTKAPLLAYVSGFCRQTGILIEPVYTGKLCYAVADLAARNYFKAGDRILLIHTGGLMGILGTQ